MSSTGKLLFVYDYFYPAFRAGGPIQSLMNLVAVLQHEFEVSVITGCNDYHVKEALKGVQMNGWSKMLLPDSDIPVQIWYAGDRGIKRKIFSKFISDKAPSVVYLNGMFSYRFVLKPLLSINQGKCKVVLAPRGMLQGGALAGKSFKKKLYLKALKLSGLVKNITWHATNKEEMEDIRRMFGTNAKITVAPNFPKRPVIDLPVSNKIKGQLRLVYLSLIAAKKNLLQVIELVNQSTENISLDIYGPLKDKGYWKSCQQAIGPNNNRIKYRGELHPEQVQETFSRYDASILLTKGENFGHALYESLSVGRPVITSYFTPWKDLEKKRAGWNLDIFDEKRCLEDLESISKMGEDEFEEYCRGAYALAKDYYEHGVDIESYRNLFSVD